MSRTMSLLKAEHKTMGMLLDILEKQADKVESRSDADRYVIGEITEYFRCYPDMYHHPKEDLIFDVLVKKSPEIAKKLGDLEKVHEDISLFLHNFTKVVVKFLIDPDAHRDRFLKDVRTFISNERKHMQMEEQFFFPTAIDQLSDKEWSVIDKKVEAFSDPLEDEDHAERFQQLGKTLKRWRTEGFTS